MINIVFNPDFNYPNLFNTDLEGVIALAEEYVYLNFYLTEFSCSEFIPFAECLSTAEGIFDIQDSLKDADLRVLKSHSCTSLLIFDDHEKSFCLLKNALTLYSVLIKDESSIVPYPQVTVRIKKSDFKLIKSTDKFKRALVLELDYAAGYGVLKIFNTTATAEYPCEVVDDVEPNALIDRDIIASSKNIPIELSVTKQPLILKASKNCKGVAVLKNKDLYFFGPTSFIKIPKGIPSDSDCLLENFNQVYPLIEGKIKSLPSYLLDEEDKLYVIKDLEEEEDLVKDALYCVKTSAVLPFSFGKSRCPIVNSLPPNFDGDHTCNLEKNYSLKGISLFAAPIQKTSIPEDIKVLLNATLKYDFTIFLSSLTKCIKDLVMVLSSTDKNNIVCIRVTNEGVFFDGYKEGVKSFTVLHEKYDIYEGPDLHLYVDGFTLKNNLIVFKPPVSEVKKDSKVDEFSILFNDPDSVVEINTEKGSIYTIPIRVVD